MAYKRNKRKIKQKVTNKVENAGKKLGAQYEKI